MDTPRTGSGAIREATAGENVVSRVTPAPDTRWTAADYQALHDRLEVEIGDLRAVVDVEVTAAVAGIVPPQYVAPYAERTELRPLPDDHPLARREPWWSSDLTPVIDELTRRPGEGWWP